jgi:hypothetical protein
LIVTKRCVALSEILPDGQITKLAVQPPSQKLSILLVGQIISTTSRHPVPQEGRIMIVTDVGMGCGGRGSIRRAGVRRAGFARERKNGVQTNDAEADGKTVWS